MEREHRRNYIEARGGSCLLLISRSFQWEQLPCASNDIESFGGFFLSGFNKATFNRPKSMTLRQHCAHRRISEELKVFATLIPTRWPEFIRVLVYDVLTTQISRWDSSQSVPWRDKDDVTLTWHVSHVVSTFCWNKSCQISV